MGNRAGCAHAAQYVGARHERKGRPSQPLLWCVVRDEAEEGRWVPRAGLQVNKPSCPSDGSPSLCPGVGLGPWLTVAL